MHAGTRWHHRHTQLLTIGAGCAPRRSWPRGRCAFCFAVVRRFFVGASLRDNNGLARPRSLQSTCFTFLHLRVRWPNPKAAMRRWHSGSQTASPRKTSAAATTTGQHRGSTELGGARHAGFVTCREGSHRFRRHVCLCILLPCRRGLLARPGTHRSGCGEARARKWLVAACSLARETTSPFPLFPVAAGGERECRGVLPMTSGRS